MIHFKGTSNRGCWIGVNTVKLPNDTKGWYFDRLWNIWPPATHAKGSLSWNMDARNFRCEMASGLASAWTQRLFSIITIAKWISMGRLSRSSSEDFKFQKYVNIGTAGRQLLLLGGHCWCLTKWRARQDARRWFAASSCCVWRPGAEEKRVIRTRVNELPSCSMFSMLEIFYLETWYKWVDLEEVLGMLSSFMFHCFNVIHKPNLGC